MNTQSRGPRAEDGSRLERAIVLQLLSGEGEPRWSRAQLREELGAEAPQFDAALGRLERDGVVCLGEDQAWASPAAVRLDELELISV